MLLFFFFKKVPILLKNIRHLTTFKFSKLLIRNVQIRILTKLLLEGQKNIFETNFHT